MAQADAKDGGRLFFLGQDLLDGGDGGCTHLQSRTPNRVGRTSLGDGDRSVVKGPWAIAPPGRQDRYSRRCHRRLRRRSCNCTAPAAQAEALKPQARARVVLRPFPRLVQRIRTLMRAPRLARQRIWLYLSPTSTARMVMLPARRPPPASQKAGHGRSFYHYDQENRPQSFELHTGVVEDAWFLAGDGCHQIVLQEQRLGPLRTPRTRRTSSIPGPQGKPDWDRQTRGWSRPGRGSRFCPAWSRRSAVFWSALYRCRRASDGAITRTDSCAHAHRVSMPAIPGTFSAAIQSEREETAFQ